MMPALSAGEADPETDVAGIQRPAGLAELASRERWLERIDQSAVRRHPRELGREVRRTTGSPLVVHAKEHPTLRSDVRWVAMRVILARDERKLLRMLEVDVRTSGGRITNLSAAN